MSPGSQFSGGQEGAKNTCATLARVKLQTEFDPVQKWSVECYRRLSPDPSPSYQSSVTPLFSGTKTSRTLVLLCFRAITEGRMIRDRSLLTSFDFWVFCRFLKIDQEVAAPRVMRVQCAASRKLHLHTENSSELIRTVCNRAGPIQLTPPSGQKLAY